MPSESLDLNCQGFEGARSSQLHVHAAVDVRRLRQLEYENGRLKKLLSEWDSRGASKSGQQPSHLGQLFYPPNVLNVQRAG